MKAAVVLVLILGVVHELSGLKCRGEDDGSDDAEFRDAVRTCTTGDFRWNPESDGEDADFKYSPYGRRSHRPGQSTSDSRHRNVRSGNSRGRPDSGGMERDYRTYGNPDQTRTDAETEEQPLHQMEPCAVHCIFRQLGMLNNDDMPDKGTMTYVMTRNVREQRVKWFIEDSVDECFELFQPENRSGKCDFAKNLGLCFQEKGRRTCEDWDGAVSDQENDNKNNNQNNHNNQNNNNNHNHNNNQNNNNNNHYKLH